MRLIKNGVVIMLVVLALAGSVATAAAGDSSGGTHTYNTKYIFAATKSTVDMDTHPALIALLVPGALVFDLVTLPAATIAGFF